MGIYVERVLATSPLTESGETAKSTVVFNSSCPTVLHDSSINAKFTTSDFLKLPRKHTLAILSMYKRLSYMHFLICRKNFCWLFSSIYIVWLILQQGPPGGVSGMVRISIQDVKEHIHLHIAPINCLGRRSRQRESKGLEILTEELL